MRAALAMCALAVGAASTPSVALALPVEFTMPPRATKAVCEPAPITSALPDLGATGAHRQRPIDALDSSLDLLSGCGAAGSSGC